MKKLVQFAFIALISAGITAPLMGQDPAQKQEKKDQEQVQLKDQNQNKGITQNKEQNRIIHGPNFVDKDGDGFNDNAPDHDNDGIPNGQDQDYQGAGKSRRPAYVDKDGDGIADNLVQRRGRGYGRKSSYGPANGTGNQGVRPQNGTGYGPGASSGNCDGTGPKGKTNRGPNR
ncbi:MAG: hypothetical protein EH225_09630 [Calditrichaeota bacterium]|nr:hypothetical protein [Calditrichota bacterium]RQW01362.1 MAG: hypothetical protein EH225_09630 [Calditrichota bacterium]